ncbi:YccF domain-containing protein [Enorma phocaeensis]|uniref:YccF domain-containing protein n=1 Tax=Enorma phocaeensis TaxID=1871019 RepID=UPI001EF71B38|nr:YccF domain-containing protein [Enorma phocaeensis]
MSVLFNIVWICTGGISTALGFLVMGLICCITVVGIPFGLHNSSRWQSLRSGPSAPP